MPKDCLGNELPANWERLRMLEAAYHVIRNNGTCDEALSMMDDISDVHLASFIMTYAYPRSHTRNGVTYVRDAVEAALGEADNIQEHLDDLNETQFEELGDYLDRLGEVSFAGHLKDAFFQLCDGLDVTVQTSRIDKNTGLPLSEHIESIIIDGHKAQRRIALALQMSLFREFDEFMDGHIRFLKEQVNKELHQMKHGGRENEKGK